MAPQPSSATRVADKGRPRVFYISYDGMAEPLGRSQVLAYLFRLAVEYDITLFSFEKPGSDLEALAREIGSYGIDWRPLEYHKNPPLLSTLLDVGRGCWALVQAAREDPPELVHVRSYVPALMAVWTKHWTSDQLLFDIRGFWADERVEGGIWPADRTVYRILYVIAKRCESRFFRDATAVVTLTHASVSQIQKWAGGRELDVTVIPTCVDRDRFGETQPRYDGPVVTWCGSIGTWYRFDLVPMLMRHLSLELQVITRQPELAAAHLEGAPATIRSLQPEQVPEALHPGDVGLSLCVSSFSKIASAPTRFAEYLASGMPVVVNSGVGDLVDIVETHRVGVVLRGDDDGACADAAVRLRELLGDPGLSERCRGVARDLFDIDAGSSAYSEIYRRLVMRSRSRRVS